MIFKCGEHVIFVDFYDEVIIKKKHLEKAYSIFNNVLSEHLTFYRIKGNASQPIETPQLGQTPKTPIETPPEPVYCLSKPEQPKPENWEQDLKELVTFFAGTSIPQQPVKLNQWCTITNCSLFIESHIATIKANEGNRTYLPYLSRLKELKAIIE